MNIPLRYRLTFDEFCNIVRDGQKADLIDGVIHMASPENTDGNKLFMWLGGLLDDFVAARELGDVFGSRVAFRLDDENSPEPDIAFVSAAHRDRIHRGRVEGPPDLAIEIVSPESVDRDYRDKRKQYQRAGVAEYWIVDEMQRKVTLLRPDERGGYRAVKPRRGVLHSTVLPGFWLRPEWLWPPRPAKAAILRQLLAEIEEG